MNDNELAGLTLGPNAQAVADSVGRIADVAGRLLHQLSYAGEKNKATDTEVLRAVAWFIAGTATAAARRENSAVTAEQLVGYLAALALEALRDGVGK